MLVGWGSEWTEGEEGPTFYNQNPVRFCDETGASLLPALLLWSRKQADEALPDGHTGTSRVLSCILVSETAGSPDLPPTAGGCLFFHDLECPPPSRERRA